MIIGRWQSKAILSGLLWLMTPLMATELPPAPSITLTLSGLSGELQDNVHAQLTLTTLKTTPNTSERQIRYGHQQAEHEIRQALRPFGYYQPEIQASLTTEGSAWNAQYQVNPGPQVTIGQRDLQLLGPDQHDPRFITLLNAFPLKPGDPLHHGQYETGKKSLLLALKNQGYLDAQYSLHRLRVDIAKQRADIVLHLDMGRRYHIKTIRFQQDFLDEDLLTRYLPQQPEFPYTTKALLDIHSALTGSRYFDLVDIRPGVEAKDEQQAIPVDIILRANASHYFSAGAGYGTDTGARLSSEWQWRHLNRRGHDLTTTLNISQLRADIAAAYTLPLERPQQEKLRFTLALQDEYGADLPSSSLKLGINRTHVFQWGSWPRPWIQTLFTHYLLEEFEISDTTESSQFIVVGSQYESRYANDDTYPTRGWLLGFSLQGAAEPVLSSTSLIQGKVWGKFIFRLSDNSRVKWRGELGSTWVDDFSQLPKSLRYFAGGDNSVRGYGYEDLGPTNADGQVIGGKHLAVGSLEYDYRFRPKWAAAVFYDLGMAINTTASLSDQLFSGVGTGVRWFSPVGPIRLDIAFPLDESADTWRLHVTIGADL